MIRFDRALRVEGRVAAPHLSPPHYYYAEQQKILVVGRETVCCLYKGELVFIFSPDESRGQHATFKPMREDTRTRGQANVTHNLRPMSKYSPQALEYSN